MREITSKDNTIIKYVKKLSSSAKFRRSEGRFIAEGLRVCVEAALSHTHIYTLLLTESALTKYNDVLQPLIECADEKYLLSEKVMQSVSDTVTPQGVLCVVKTLDNDIDFDTIKNKYILLESIQDPSNLGTILRTADALGANGVIMTADCCDVYSPKVCRGAMGALFRVPLSIVPNAPSFIEKFQNSGGSAYAAVVRGGEPLGDEAFFERSLIVIGNEGNGLSSDTISACDKSVTIPMKGIAESLNASVAASILMWEMMK